MSGNWLSAAAKWQEEGERFVVVTVLSVRGSAPCEVGRRMLVAKDRQHGTIGGGRLEQEVLEQARRQLSGKHSDSDTLLSLSLGSTLGQCCGGKVIVHHEVVQESIPTIAIFGAGHIGQELTRILARLPNQIVIVDSRQSWLDRIGDIPSIRCVLEDDPVDAVADLKPAGVCVVMTHRHDTDLEICRALLARGDMRMVGVIGSESKAARFVRELKARGLDPNKLTCPIGAQGGKLPAQVAINIAAEICKALVDGKQEVLSSKQASRMMEEILASMRQD